MARKKTTVYIDEELLTAAKVAAARSRKHEYEVFEEALRSHLGLREAVEGIRGSAEDDAVDEQEALRVAYAELDAAREGHSGAKAS